ncbi:Six-hairpin glycosidase-like protein [Mycena rebaudengoi]|nr:Six-hairpin glycosidase-like protein [Mycena rebaudengoi]
MWAILLVALYAYSAHCSRPIDRRSLVARYNPTRNASSPTTPMQVGNGNFAFGADITGLQTFQPWAIMSSWGWKNDSLPAGQTLADVYNYTGVSWNNHGRPVEYMFNGPGAMQSWLISNPNRVNLGAVGLVFWSESGEVLNITEKNLTAATQELDLWTGTLTSSFAFNGVPITVKTVSAQEVDSIGITVTSALLETGRLGVFVDFPWNDGSRKFSAPFVGTWNNASIHTTTLHTGIIKTQTTMVDTRDNGVLHMIESTENGVIQYQIIHTQVDSSFITSLGGDAFKVTRDSPTAHRYSIRPKLKSNQFSLTTTWGLKQPKSMLSPSAIALSSAKSWEHFWTASGFVDVFTGSTDPRADELQRRIILSRYLMRVNEAGDYPPQESGLYGKFHLEMYWWHAQHWALWNNWDIISRSSEVYHRFLDTSIARAQVQEGWATGARWGKMSDPSGRSAPGQINDLLIWQQLVFANYEYRAFPTEATLRKWEPIVRNTADWMATFAWFNETSGFYDLGPPLYVVSEDNSPNNTYNPAFELAYWRLGLGLAETWMERLGEPVPSNWTIVKKGLAKLPVNNGTYKVSEDIEDNFWTDPEYINDHPALVGLHGWLPPTEGLDLGIAKLTAEKVWSSWNISNVWGWDFPMLAMSAARNGEPEKALEWLLHPLFPFDDAGMPVGGVRVPTPYFPGSGALLFAVALMAEGWDGSQGAAPGFPTEGWNVRAEGLSKAM